MHEIKNNKKKKKKNELNYRGGGRQTHVYMQQQHLARHVVGVEVEGAEVLVYAVDGGETLDGACRRLQQRRPRLRRLPRHRHLRMAAPRRHN